MHTPSHMETDVKCVCILSYIAAGSDFTQAIVPLVFGPTTSEMCRNINISEDRILEGVEDFSLQLTTADPAVILSPRTANVTIIDMDGKLEIYMQT